jgi:hypothetical protein
MSNASVGCGIGIVIKNIVMNEKSGATGQGREWSRR